jgi:hypothetical protein
MTTHSKNHLIERRTRALGNRPDGVKLAALAEAISATESETREASQQLGAAPGKRNNELQ